jgi:Rap1a immunity proteins
MRHLLVTLLGAVACSLIWGTASADTVKELLQSCEAVTHASKPSKGDAVDIPPAGVPCWYYMSAIQNMSALTDEHGERLLGICPLADSTLMQFVQAFVQFAHKNRKDLYGNAAAFAISGLGEVFPCR